MNDEGYLKEDIKKVEEYLKTAWNTLPNKLFEVLIINIEKRVKMCIEANGWHTKYQKFNLGQES